VGKQLAKMRDKILIMATYFKIGIYS